MVGHTVKSNEIKQNMADQGHRTFDSSPSRSAFKSSGVTKYIDEDDDDQIKVEIIETIRPVTKPNCDKPNTSRDGTVSPSKYPPVPNKRKLKPTDAQPLSVQNAVAPKPVSPDPGGCRVTNKPPLPPKPQNLSKMKKKIEQLNEQTVGKLSAQTEQLRLEIAELKAALTSEKNAVRVLRAQHESENRKAKADIKRLQDLVQKENAKKSAVPPVKRVTKDQNGLNDAATVTAPLSHHNFAPELVKLNNEISALKDANRSLEEKYQISIEAERRKTSDIREQKDSYELRLTQITKSAKCEMHRLLEELKTKERNIGFMKKEIQSLKSSQKRDASRSAHDSHVMRNSKESEQSDASPVTNQLTNSNSFNVTTCENDLKLLLKTTKENTHSDVNSNVETSGNGFKSLPHEFSNRLMEAHNNLELQIIRNELNMGSDSDSAVSSAPPSLSPQPSSYSHSPDVWKMNSGHLQANDADKIEKLEQELTVAREHIKDLEEALEHESRKDDRTQKLREKIKLLTQREEALQQETNELREQNELLEFRIIELEETHDKWSLRSNTTPDTKDVWTDTEKETDDILLMSDHSDSGIISPHSHHQLDDHQSLTPCDLSLMDQMPSEEMRKRLVAMAKRSCYDEEDRMCLLQIVTLINNLEVVSQQHDHPNSNESSLDSIVHKYKISEYPADTKHQPTHRSLNLSPSLKNQGKIVATIQPYTSSGASSIDDSCHESTPKRTLNKSWLTNSLQESGVFESENCLEIQSQGTQTEIADFPCLDKTNAELCAEIDKLNKFREEIEECSAKKTGTFVVAPAATKRQAPQTLDQRRLQYYQERLLQIENKLLIYESTGDLQVQRLAERLQRELHLESLVKQLTEKIMLLESVNYNLEDERCELEEIENDTRLRLQRMEIDLEVLNQSNIELEMSRSSYMNKFQDAKTSIANLEESLVRAEERIFVLEEHENELKHKLDMITAFMPVILLFNSWKTHEDIKKSLLGSTRLQRQQHKQQLTSTCLTLDTVQLGDVCANPSEVKLHTLMNREKELMQNIAELNRAYNETLENADNLWAQMEKEYKDKINRCEEVESNLKTKIIQLEDSLRKDHVYAQERIFALEETEAEQQNRNTKLNRENKELHAKYTTVQEELTALKEEYATLQNYIKGPAMETLEKEKKKVRKLEDELLLSKRMIENLEEVHKDEINMVKSQLMRTNKELTHIEVTNSELREEVDTLETRIRELMAERSRNEDKLQRLSQELQGKQNQVLQMQQIVRVPNKSLAQELGRPVKRNYTVDGSQIHAATRGLSEAIDFFEENIKAQQSSSNNNFEAKEVTKEVKSLADSIISSAEARGARPIKKSFVEETKTLRLRGGGRVERRLKRQMLYVEDVPAGSQPDVIIAIDITESGILNVAAQVADTSKQMRNAKFQSKITDNGDLIVELMHVPSNEESLAGKSKNVSFHGNGSQVTDTLTDYRTVPTEGAASVTSHEDAEEYFSEPEHSSEPDNSKVDGDSDTRMISSILDDFLDQIPYDEVMGDFDEHAFFAEPRASKCQIEQILCAQPFGPMGLTRQQPYDDEQQQQHPETVEVEKNDGQQFNNQCQDQQYQTGVPNVEDRTFVPKTDGSSSQAEDRSRTTLGCGKEEDETICLRQLQHTINDIKSIIEERFGNSASKSKRALMGIEQPSESIPSCYSTDTTSCNANIIIDGIATTRIYSSTRQSALLQDVNPFVEHLLEIHAIPLNDNVDPRNWNPGYYCYCPDG